MRRSRTICVGTGLVLPTGSPPWPELALHGGAQPHAVRTGTEGTDLPTQSWPELQPGMGGLKPSDLGCEEGRFIPISLLGKLRLWENKLGCPGDVNVDLEPLVILIGCFWSDIDTPL